MRAWLIITIAAAVAACIDSNATTCSDNLICPGGTTCRELTNPSDEVCATPDQITACVGITDGTACTVTSGTPSSCHDGVCLPIVCGNGRLDPGEVCDDGNAITGDGTCSGDCQSTEKCGNGVVDPLKLTATGPALNEECDDGNLRSGDGCSSDCKIEQPQWQQLGVSPPGQLAGAALAYDAGRRRVVMFGGLVIDPITTKESGVATTYEWNGTGWTLIPTPIAPAGRWNAQMAYDAARRRIVLFGGQDGDDKAAFGDMWEWDGRHWTSIQTSLPPARSEFGMVYDSARKVIVLFGGIVGDAPAQDTWEWDGTAWHAIATAAVPPARYLHSMAYDPKRGVTVLAGGSSDLAGPTDDTWEYDGTNWHAIATTTPVDLMQSGMAYDPVSNRIITYGGQLTTSPNISTKTFAYDGHTWTDLSQATPSLHYQAQLATDTVNGRVVMFGGVTSVMTSPATETNQTWLWSGTSWSLAPVQTAPAAGLLTASGYDPSRAEAWMFGGDDPAQNPTNHLWSFDGSTWTPHVAAGGPTARSGAAVAFDTAHHQLVLFGGQLNSTTLAPNQTFLWDGQTWTVAAPTTSPQARFGATMTYDSKRQRVVMFSGVTLTGVLDETWEWDGTDWNQLTPATMPAGREAASATFDPVRGVTLIENGVTTAPVLYNDLWAWDGAAWTALSDPTPLPTRLLNSLVYVPAREDAVVFGGQRIGGIVFDDTWEWDGTQWQQSVLADRPSARTGQMTFPGRDGADAIIFGGISNLGSANVPFDEMWRLTYDNASPREQCEQTVDNDLDGLAGCADPDCWASCTPLCPPGTTCDPAAPHCGDGTCNTALENCRSCPGDCGACLAVCGDTFCDPGETIANCPGDCTP